jgi:hypothetical protein
MARTIWNSDDRESLLRRFDSLDPARKPLWGEMTPSQMVKHCALPMCAAMGEMKVASRNKVMFQIWPLRPLIIHVLPWPKGAPTAPEFIIKDDADYRARVSELREVVQRFCDRPESASFTPHPLFGPLTRADWGSLQYRHLNHHLQQFGV